MFYSVTRKMKVDDFHSGKKKIEDNDVHQPFGYRHSSKYLSLCSAEERN